MEILGCPVVKTPLSASLVWSKGMRSSTFGTRLAAGVAGVRLHCALIRLQGSTPDLKGLLPYTWPLDRLGSRPPASRWPPEAAPPPNGAV